MTWRSRITGFGSVDPHTLVPNPRNPRKHPSTQMAALDDILTKIGWLQDVIVNTTTGRMLDGHARVERALRTHQPTVPVKYVELSEAEEMLALATFDPLGAIADVDQAATDTLVTRIRESDEELAGSLAELLASLETPPPPLPYVHGELEATTYMLLVECTDEQQQIAVLERLSEEGEDCRALVS